MSLWADVGCHAIPLSRQYSPLRRLGPGPGQTPEGMWCSSLVLRGDLPEIALARLSNLRRALTWAHCSLIAPSQALLMFSDQQEIQGAIPKRR